MKDTKVILYDDKAACKKVKVTAYQDSSGRVWLDENMARYSSMTHRTCDCCGTLCSKHYLYCNVCQDKRKREKWESLEKITDYNNSIKWLYDEYTDKYYSELNDLLEDYEESEIDIKLAMPVICKHNYARCIEDDYWEDDVPEDMSFEDCAEVTQEIIDMIENLNEKLKETVLSYSPSNKRLVIE